MKRFLLKSTVGIITLLLFALISGCSGKTADQGETVKKQLVYGMESEIDKVNPILDESQEIDTLLYRGLTKPNEQNEVTPDLAESWSVSEDQLTYTFQLRKDAVWQDGESVKPEDVVFTLEKILDPSTNTPIAGEFSEIAKVETTGDHEVRITLHKPYPPLLDKLKVGIVPKHVLDGENLNETEYNRNPIGNGPFKLKEWKSDGTIILERNTRYYGQTPKLDEVVFKAIPDANTRLVQLKAGEIDLAHLSPAQLKAVKESDSFTLHELETADYRAILFNLDLDIFQDPKVRQAISLAVDREALVEGVLLEKGEAAYGPLQKSWVANPRTDLTGPDYKQAQELLENAGWKKNEDGILEKDGKRFEFELVAPAQDPVRVALVNVVSQQLKRIGILAEPKPVDQNAVRYDGEEALLIGWGSEYDPDDHTYRLFHSSEIGDGRYNFGKYRNLEVDRLLTAARTATDPEERKELYVRFQKELTQDPPYTFLVYLKALYGVNNEVTGISTRILGHHGFGVLWNIEEWDKQEK
ncbi:peptide/opine/nickel uptake ABC transporter substrate-binding protein [Bacillus sp. OxB-1]|uniref:ABC transporter substrate-binding protein n=1 Tax=Bacillus sp. (strain OxB-1) TaxID=98228 RepID=UPI000582317A|nr:ABC transporter substrate-binding protein [Bacillus sp. OxB-1]BAQ10320.1 peptide/opine/nickel uptake ABC transporter substrate-binding protein [Bacillus sp. OxB-1]